MPIYNVCAVYDEKAESYYQAQNFPVIGVAHRHFLDLIDEQESMKKHKSDFRFYHVANFDSSTGQYENIVPPRLIAVGSDIS